MKTFVCLLFLVVCVAPISSSEANAYPAQTQLTPEYRLRFFQTHTNQRIDVVFRRGTEYVPDALEKLDYYLRDWRTGEVHHYDPRVFDLLYELLASVHDSDGEIDVICGYRTPQTNEFLRNRNAHTGVAAQSLHMQAEAIDIRLPSTTTAQTPRCCSEASPRRSWLLRGFELCSCRRRASTPLVTTEIVFSSHESFSFFERRAGI